MTRAHIPSMTNFSFSGSADRIFSFLDFLSVEPTAVALFLSWMMPSVPIGGQLPDAQENWSSRRYRGWKPGPQRHEKYSYLRCSSWALCHPCPRRLHHGSALVYCPNHLKISLSGLQIFGAPVNLLIFINSFTKLFAIWMAMMRFPRKSWIWLNLS